MTDIVELLRDQAERLSGNMMSEVRSRLEWEAADTIEAQAKEIGRLQQALSSASDVILEAERATWKEEQTLNGLCRDVRRSCARYLETCAALEGKE